MLSAVSIVTHLVLCSGDISFLIHLLKSPWEPPLLSQLMTLESLMLAAVLNIVEYGLKHQ